MCDVCASYIKIFIANEKKPWMDANKLFITYLHKSIDKNDYDDENVSRKWVMEDLHTFTIYKIKPYGSINATGLDKNALKIYLHQLTFLR